MLDFSRMERGKAAYEMKPGDLGEVVEQALDFFPAIALSAKGGSLKSTSQSPYRARCWMKMR